jgi:S-formylglutathione hydrolase FrmB
VLVAIAVVAAVAGPWVVDPVRAVGPGDECVGVAPSGALAVTVGTVDCIRLPSGHMGGEVPISYYVPPACDPALGRRCPVLYYLHGTGGSYREGTGAKGSAGNAWVHALTAGPPADPRASAEPWTLGESTWVAKPALDLIIVSPHGRTLSGGRGPAPDLDTGWFDWNPRYASDGDTPRYATPPPQPSSFLTDELVPYVDAHFPTDATRQWRAILGYSQGGFGSYINGLTRPDIWSSMGMRSGGALPLVAPGDLADDSVLVTGVAPPAALPFLRLPGLVMSAAPDVAFQTNIVAEVTTGFGDPVADQAWWRASNPSDLISNARARAADGTQSVHLQHFVNDAIPRRPVEDATRYADGGYMALVYEALLFPTDLYMERLFDRYGVERTFRVGPGDHSGVYGVPYFREQLEGQYANLRHWDGASSGRPDPERFDYRTVRTDFTIWGWRFDVDRQPVEFLNLTNVSCSSITLRGTGRVNVTAPPACGVSPFVVDLGPSQPLDEPAGLGTSRGYGRTVTVALSS